MEPSLHQRLDRASFLVITPPPFFLPFREEFNRPSPRKSRFLNCPGTKLLSYQLAPMTRTVTTFSCSMVPKFFVFLFFFSPFCIRRLCVRDFFFSLFYFVCLARLVVFFFRKNTFFFFFCPVNEHGPFLVEELRTTFFPRFHLCFDYFLFPSDCMLFFVFFCFLRERFPLLSENYSVKPVST